MYRRQVRTSFAYFGRAATGPRNYPVSGSSSPCRDSRGRDMAKGQKTQRAKKRSDREEKSRRRKDSRSRSQRRLGALRLKRATSAIAASRAINQHAIAELGLAHA